MGMIYCVTTQHWSVAILIMGFVFVIWVIGWRLHKRFAFSNVLIKLGAKLMMRNSQVWITYWLMLLTNSIMVLLYLVTALASIITFMDEPDQKIRYTVFGFLLFTGYYFAQLFRNAVQLVIGIIFSKWYFRSKVSYWTASFHIFFKGLGSVCVGSLFSSLLSLFKLVLLFFQQSKLHKQYLLLKPLLWCITSIVHILDETSRYFNEYAFAYMSIHGDGYFTSSSGVFSLHSSRGYDAFLIGSVIKLVLRLYIVSAGFLGTVASYYYLCYFYGYYLHSGTNIKLFYILSVTSGVILMQISRILAMIVNSYVHVLFICVLEYRQLLETCHSREYAALKATRL